MIKPLIPGIYLTNGHNNVVSIIVTNDETVIYVFGGGDTVHSTLSKSAWESYFQATYELKLPYPSYMKIDSEF